jgi:hypothetical protein
VSRKTVCMGAYPMPLQDVHFVQTVLLHAVLCMLHMTGSFILLGCIESMANSYRELALYCCLLHLCVTQCARADWMVTGMCQHATLVIQLLMG